MAERGAERQEVRRLLNKIRDRQATVLRLRFGLDGAVPMSLEDIGREMGISRERVLQIRIRALRALRGDATARELGLAS